MLSKTLEDVLFDTYVKWREDRCNKIKEEVNRLEEELIEVKCRNE